MCKSLLWMKSVAKKQAVLRKKERYDPCVSPPRNGLSWACLGMVLGIL